MIGILCGLKSEAKLADKIPGVIVGCSAARPVRALTLARHMAEQGVTRLVSFGLAAGLSPEVGAGDLLLGATVMASKRAWEADVTWHDKLIERIPQAMAANFWGSSRMAKTQKEKRLVFTRTGCMALDMESHIVAQMAEQFGIPFNVIRAVSDPALMDLPPAAQVPLHEDGAVSLGGVFSSIRQDPRQLGDLMRLGVSTHKAMATLSQAVKVMREMMEEG